MHTCGRGYILGSVQQDSYCCTGNPWQSESEYRCDAGMAPVRRGYVVGSVEQQGCRCHPSDDPATSCSCFDNTTEKNYKCDAHVKWLQDRAGTSLQAACQQVENECPWCSECEEHVLYCTPPRA